MGYLISEVNLWRVPPCDFCCFAQVKLLAYKPFPSALKYFFLKYLPQFFAKAERQEGDQLC